MSEARPTPREIVDELAEHMTSPEPTGNPEVFRYPHRVTVDRGDVERHEPSPRAVYYTALRDRLAGKPAVCLSCLHGVEAHRVGDVCVADNCNCQEKP